MASRKSNRKHGIIDDLPSAVKDAVEQMLLTNCRYAEVIDYLAGQGIRISPASVCRYAQNYHASVQLLNVAQENMRRMMVEMDKYPGLDTTEAVVRLMSQHILTALTNMTENDLKKVDVAKLLKETNALIKAVAYKKRIDLQNKDESEAGMDAIQQVVFEAMARERPDLYAQVTTYLESKKQGGLTDPESAEV